MINSKGYIDSHAHLTSPEVYERADQILTEAWKVGIRNIVNICTDVETLDKGFELTQRYPWVSLTAATTPHDVARDGEAHFEHIAQAARNGRLVAVGETGLDYYYAHSPKEIQQQFFRRYINLALETNLPLVIHCRDAFEDLYKILDEKYTPLRKERVGVLHCFTGTLEEALEGIRRGWMVSFSGIVTFKKSVELKEVAKALPLKHLLIETDTPFLAPQSRRGQPNQPAFIVETARCLAELRGVSEEEIVEATARNARSLFAIKS